MASVHFLNSYVDLLSTSQWREEPQTNNGKGPAIEVGLSAAKDRPAEVWEPPPRGWVKINIDGAFDASGKAGLGVVIRDYMGKVLLTSWRVVFNGSSAKQLEALACKGVKLGAEWVNKLAVVESDCLNLVSMLQDESSSYNRSVWCYLLQDIRSVCNRLPGVKFQAVRRELNQVAHEFTQLVKRTTHTAVWRYAMPVCVEELIAQECNAIE